MNDKITESLNHKQIIDFTAEFVKDELKDAEGGHDWYHIKRVWKNALYIAKQEEKGNLLVIELAALLHDIADAKFHNGDETIGPRKAKKFLLSIYVPVDVIEDVINIIENISFRKRHSSSEYNSVELEIVQDADRLDAIGAIGIARVFNFGGFKHRPLYEPSNAVTQNGNGNAHRHTIGHFYDKLLLLSGMMNTLTGKKLAEERHQFMVKFLEQFYREWEGHE